MQKVFYQNVLFMHETVTDREAGEWASVDIATGIQSNISWEETYIDEDLEETDKITFDTRDQNSWVHTKGETSWYLYEICLWSISAISYHVALLKRSKYARNLKNMNFYENQTSQPQNKIQSANWTTKSATVFVFIVSYLTIKTWEDDVSVLQVADETKLNPELLKKIRRMKSRFILCIEIKFIGKLFVKEKCSITLLFLFLMMWIMMLLLLNTS